MVLPRSRELSHPILQPRRISLKPPAFGQVDINMPPKRRAPRWAASNARGQQRRDAVRLMNRIAEDIGVKPIRVKAPKAEIEKTKAKVVTKTKST